eukprot:CAMPEP_0182940118 /NCGR_PEP_ID=MMETSP0105_2-20130417/46789_1 /TAXON_ID=81532 ORGANISM="Acanthoeca-like sp., Strain 10tr" /NCGR_SAMPLE_ID=MMETSP0105_2 /ASSEMBLY_ACC=CAM_ASM_000205 /LENGTH=49 /DNA_ID=CAMNT_0025079587 /DNA_START=63 /DNA_END=212 /DNA_ORIENTATION=-
MMPASLTMSDRHAASSTKGYSAPIARATASPEHSERSWPFPGVASDPQK